MLLRKIISVYAENHMKHINKWHGQNSEFFVVKAGVIHTNLSFKLLEY
jgi:hypothetical protein